MNKYDFGENEINNIEISEITSIELPKILTINSLIKYYDDCELGTIILPLYIYKTKKSKNVEDIKLISKYFSYLVNVYLSLENKDDNLISEYTNKYKKSFELMISKFMSVGFKTNLFHFKITSFNPEEMIFELPQIGKYNIPKIILPKMKS